MSVRQTSPPSEPVAAASELHHSAGARKTAGSTGSLTGIDHIGIFLGGLFKIDHPRKSCHFYPASLLMWVPLPPEVGPSAEERAACCRNSKRLSLPRYAVYGTSLLWRGSRLSLVCYSGFVDKIAQPVGSSQMARIAALSFEELAAQQGVTPVDDFETLFGAPLPEDESAEDFSASLREWRREGNRPPKEQ